jgi:hypothetical protein
MSDKAKVDRQTKVLKPSKAARPAVGSANESAPAAANLQKPINSAQDLAGGDVAALQQTYGNHFVQRLAGINGIDGDDAGVRPTTDIESEIEQTRGGGGQLPDAFRSKMEGHFKTDFKGVRVHTDGQADQLSRSLNAKAFTTGSDIYFRQGDYDPDSHGGQKLIAHELTHVVQQGGTQRKATQAKLSLNEPDDKYEKEADVVAEAAVKGDETKTAAATTSSETAAETTPTGDEAPVEQETLKAMNAVTKGEKVEEAAAMAGVTTDKVHQVEADIKAGADPETAVADIANDKKQEAQAAAAEAPAGQPEHEGQATAEKIESEKEEGGQEKEKEEKEKEEEKEEKGEDVKSGPAAVPPAAVPDDHADDQPAFETAEFEEPAIDAPLPTWGDLAYGTIQLQSAPEEVAWRNQFLGQGSTGDAALSDDIMDAAEAALQDKITAQKEAHKEEAQDSSDLDRGAMFRDAILGGMAEGAISGTSSFITGQIMGAATSKVPYGSHLLEVANLAKDPKGWSEGIKKSFTGAFEKDGVFHDIKGRWAEEDTDAGRAAFVFEFALGLINWVDGMLGSIKKILSVAVGILVALAAVLAAIPVGVTQKIAAILMKIVKFLLKIIKFIEKISGYLGMLKPPLEMLIFICRSVDFFETQSDPDKLKQKQAKLQGMVKSYSENVTKRALTSAKGAIDEKVKTAMEKHDMKRKIAAADAVAAGQQAPPPGKTKQDAIDDAQKLRNEYEDKFGKDYEGKKTKEQVMDDRGKRAKESFDQAKNKLEEAEKRGAPTEIELAKAKMKEAKTKHESIEKLNAVEKEKATSPGKYYGRRAFAYGAHIVTGVSVDTVDSFTKNPKKWAKDKADSFKEGWANFKKGAAETWESIKHPGKTIKEKFEAAKHSVVGGYHQIKGDYGDWKQKQIDKDQTALDERLKHDRVTTALTSQQESQQQQTQATIDEIDTRRVQGGQLNLDKLATEEQLKQTKTRETEAEDQLQMIQKQHNKTLQDSQQERSKHHTLKQELASSESRLETIERQLAESNGHPHLQKLKQEVQQEVATKKLEVDQAVAKRFQIESDREAQETSLAYWQEQKKEMVAEETRLKTELQKLTTQRQQHEAEMVNLARQLQGQQTVLSSTQKAVSDLDQQYKAKYGADFDKDIAEYKARIEKEGDKKKAYESTTLREKNLKDIFGIERDPYLGHKRWATLTYSAPGGGLSDSVLTSFVSSVAGAADPSLRGQNVFDIPATLAKNAIMPDGSADWAKKYGGGKYINVKFAYQGGLPPVDDDKVKEVKSEPEETVRLEREFGLGGLIDDIDFAATAPEPLKSELETDSDGVTAERKKEMYNEEVRQQMQTRYAGATERSPLFTKKIDSDNPPATYNKIIRRSGSMDEYKAAFEDVKLKINDKQYTFEPVFDRDLGSDELKFTYRYEGDDEYQKDLLDPDKEMVASGQMSRLDWTASVRFPGSERLMKGIEKATLDQTVEPQVVQANNVTLDKLEKAEDEPKYGISSLYVNTPFGDGEIMTTPKVAVKPVDIVYQQLDPAATNNEPKAKLKAKQVVVKYPDGSDDKKNSDDGSVEVGSRKVGRRSGGNYFLEREVHKELGSSGTPRIQVHVEYEAEGAAPHEENGELQYPIIQRQPAAVKKGPGELVIQRMPEEEEEEGGPIGGHKPLELIRREREMQIAGNLPEPPNESMAQVTESAIAYNTLSVEEVALKTQQQHLLSMQHDAGVQVQDFAAGEQVAKTQQEAIVAHHQDIKTHQQAQENMAAAAKSGQEPAKQSKDISGMLNDAVTSVLTSLLQAVGIAGEKAGTGNQEGGVKDSQKGIQQQKPIGEGAVKVTNQAEARAKNWHAETRALEADTAVQFNKMRQTEEFVQDRRSETENNMDGLELAMLESEVQLDEIQDQKSDEEFEHSDALLEAELWADEHYTMRQDMFSQLEAELSAEEDRRLGV